MLNVCPSQLQETPLHFACKNGHADIVTYLLTFQACDTQAKNVHGETPYDVASRNPSTNQKICDLLSGVWCVLCLVCGVCCACVHMYLKVLEGVEGPLL